LDGQHLILAHVQIIGLTQATSPCFCRPYSHHLPNSFSPHSTIPCTTAVDSQRRPPCQIGRRSVHLPVFGGGAGDALAVRARVRGSCWLRLSSRQLGSHESYAAKKWILKPWLSAAAEVGSIPRSSHGRKVSASQMRWDAHQHGIRITFLRKRNEGHHGPFGCALYRLRNRVESLINRCRQCRRLVRRDEQRAAYCQAMWRVTATTLWLKVL
jgi:hypothetical protein